MNRVLQTIIGAVQGILILIVGAIFIAVGIRTSVAERIDPEEVRVIDGDTIRVYHEQPNVRLVGFNAPETRRAVCEVERELGAKATRRLRDLVRAGDLDFEYVACSCPQGTEGTPVCNYGRDCGTLKSRGRDVGAILIEEALAVPFVCGKTHCPKTPRPWCQ
jgi:endonuclease YncB( thermonuclease family)